MDIPAPINLLESTRTIIHRLRDAIETAPRPVALASEDGQDEVDDDAIALITDAIDRVLARLNAPDGPADPGSPADAVPSCPPSRNECPRVPDRCS